MAKRNATSNLTRDNWDDEEISEEMGEFRKASPNALKMRNIKRGKRQSSKGESSGPSIFKDFTAFGSSNSSGPPSFSFITPNSNFKINSSVNCNEIKNKDNTLNESSIKSNLTSPMFSFVQSSTEAKPKKSSFSPCPEIVDDKDKNGSASGFKFGAIDNTSGLLCNNKKIELSKGFNFNKTENVATGLFNFGNCDNTLLKNDNGITSNPNSTSEQPELFLNNLKLLNMNLLDWLKQHLDKSNYVDLTPVFEDYKKHLEKIKKAQDSPSVKNQCKIASASQSSVIGVLETTTNTIPPFSFGVTSNKNKSPIKFTSKSSVNSSDTDKSAIFQFGSGGNIQKGAPLNFSLGTAASNLASNQGETLSNENSDNEIYEVNEVKEENAVYEQKVKLFYKKENSYIDKGVGTLFLKPAGDKTQLIVRALTNLGTILLNIVLNESIPTQRVGKNNVMIVCVPNPVIDTNKPTTPVSMLIRVKTTEDADQLLEKLDGLKKLKTLNV